LPRDQFDVWALITRWNKRRQYRDLVSKGFDPFDYSGDNAKRPGKRDPRMDQIHDLRGQISDAFTARDVATATRLYTQLREIDPAQVLSRQGQLDVATQYHHDHQYQQAADAYELLLKTYPTIERAEQLELMIGILYSRYLNKFDKAKEHLQKAIAKLHGGRDLDLAKEELRSIELTGK